ncbi:MAG: DUF5916 domain-containing protein [Polaribacter sp.]|nr:DUF5916 domain-containing protein [Polaribacter sp.]
MKRFTPLLLISFLCINQVSAQITKERKKMATTRVVTAPKIDAVLNDIAWKNAKIAKDFIMMRPNNGETEPKTHKTEVKVIYDDTAIYIGAILYDDKPTSIPMEFTNRDNFGQTDFFLVTINPNDDGQNPFEFVVMSTGTQADSKIANGQEDFNWNAVWESSVKVTAKGWIVEMKIPYSALRFANTPVQSWGVNFHRKIQSLNAQFTWNHIDNTKGIWTQYDGLVENFRDINPPTRLSFYPYASTSVSHFDRESNYSHSIGLDLKYGITENFTLDLTLVPDFGQTAFDNITLNLGPFEQQFSEQRQFFTEGTELFGKGDLFYSRRIGNIPTNFYAVYDELAANEEVTNNPGKVNMLNAIKISGRTQKGLGIGFFNAITDKTKATVLNTVTDETRTIVTEPYSNYNVLVLDQQFNKNSAITLINTNVTRVGDFRDANTTGLLYYVSTKDNTYFIDGSYKRSIIKEDGTKTTGNSFDTSIGKDAGNWAYEVGYDFEDASFDINDLGFQSRNNKQSIYAAISYRTLKPIKKFNTIRVQSWFNFNYLHKPATYTGNSMGIWLGLETKNRWNFNSNVSGNLGKQFDYFAAFQPVEDGHFFIKPTRITANHSGSSDSRKKFSFRYGFSKSFYFNHPKSRYRYRIYPRYRFSNQFSISYGFNYRKTLNDQGYIHKISSSDVIEYPSLSSLENEIIFGQRDVSSYNNSISGKFNFNLNSSLSLTFRHNWSKVTYENTYHTLNLNGHLESNEYSTFLETEKSLDYHNVNYNSWNLDLNYIWQFAPGSQLIAFYRNSINPSHDFAPANITFFDNLNRLFDEKMQHTFSLKFIYFIDYNKLKNIF